MKRFATPRLDACNYRRRNVGHVALPEIMSKQELCMYRAKGNNSLLFSSRNFLMLFVTIYIIEWTEGYDGVVHALQCPLISRPCNVITDILPTYEVTIGHVDVRNKI